jgi:hypothetical protein
LGTWNASGGYSRHRRRRSSRHIKSSAPAFVRYTVFAITVVLVLSLAWRGIRWTTRPGSAASIYSPPAVASAPRTPVWQSDFATALDIAQREATGGNFGSAEMAVDHAESIVTTERLQSATAPTDFFAPSLAALDRIAAQRPDDQRLIEHVTLARISIAEMRSSLAADPGGAPSAERVSIGAPREIGANQTLDPASLGAPILDATVMPDTAEILLPPYSRTFADNVRVENLIVAGAAQTIDGIHWRNVTFVGTRLRYEGGGVDLQNVRFVHCRFGFATDDRGARLANAIALGQTSFSLEQKQQ